MTLILFLTIIYLADTSGALVCYQCKETSTISDQETKDFVDGLLIERVEDKILDSSNIFCNSLGDLGVEKICDQGSYCMYAKLQTSKEKAAIRSCVKKDQLTPDDLGCVELGKDDWKFKQCYCNTNKCNIHSNGNTNGSGIGKDNVKIFRILGKSLRHDSNHQRAPILVKYCII